MRTSIVLVVFAIDALAACGNERGSHPPFMECTPEDRCGFNATGMIGGMQSSSGNVGSPAAAENPGGAPGPVVAGAVGGDAGSGGPVTSGNGITLGAMNGGPGVGLTGGAGTTGAGGVGGSAAGGGSAGGTGGSAAGGGGFVFDAGFP